MRWLSKGRSLARVSELWELLQRFLSEKQSPLAAYFRDTEWLQNLLNYIPCSTNSGYHFRGEQLLKSADKVVVFKAKLELWKQQMNTGIFDVSNISSDLKETEPRPSVSELVHDQLSQLSKEFEHYFPITKHPWTGKEWNCDPSVNKPGKLGLPRCGAVVKTAWQCKRHRFNPWVRKIPWRRAWQPTPVFLLRGSHGQRSLVGYSPGGCKQSDTTEATKYSCRHIAY